MGFVSNSLLEGI